MSFKKSTFAVSSSTARFTVFFIPIGIPRRDYKRLVRRQPNLGTTTAIVEESLPAVEPLASGTPTKVFERACAWKPPRSEARGLTQEETAHGSSKRSSMGDWRARSQVLIEAWRREYNEERPKQGLGGLTPAQYAKRMVAERSTVTLGL